MLTDASGTYRFDSLPAGRFRVDLDGVPAGLTPTADPDDGAADTATLVLAAGATNLDQDFGYVGDANIGDTVWLDLDGDGTQDAGEPGLPGVTVTVRSPGSDGVLGTSDDVSVSVDTDADGRYLVTGLPAVTTTVTYDPTDLGAGLVPDSDLDGGSATTTTVDLDPGDDRRDVDFGVVGDASLSGVVWDDRDADGVQDPGEPGIPGVTVEIVWDGPRGPVTLTVVTDENGAWRFDSIPPGDYDATIRVDTLRDGDVTTTPVTVRVTVPAGGSATVVHGATPGAAVGDRIWDDRDRDGVQDPGEPGIAGVRVTLLDVDGNTVATTTTGVDGSYRFDDLVPGTYTVVIDTSALPSGVTPTGDPDGVRDNRSSVELSPGETDLTRDFGYALPVTATPTTRPAGDLATTGATIGAPITLAAVFVITGLLLLFGVRRRPRTG